MRTSALKDQTLFFVPLDHTVIEPAFGFFWRQNRPCIKICMGSPRLWHGVSQVLECFLVLLYVYKRPSCSDLSAFLSQEREARLRGRQAWIFCRPFKRIRYKKDHKKNKNIKIFIPYQCSLWRIFHRHYVILFSFWIAFSNNLGFPVIKSGEFINKKKGIHHLKQPTMAAALLWRIPTRQSAAGNISEGWSCT